jgi:hypothetical protein
MSDTEIKYNLRNSIMDFSSGSLSVNAIRLYKELGYNTERQNPFSEKTFKYFKEYFLEDNSHFNEVKALASDWRIQNPASFSDSIGESSLKQFIHKIFPSLCLPDRLVTA